MYFSRAGACNHKMFSLPWTSPPPQPPPPCTSDNKQKALYLDYTYVPTLVDSPALDVSVEHEWNSTSDMKDFGKNGVYAAQPFGTKDGVGGYFGSQVFGAAGNDGALLFSIWDHSGRDEAAVAACMQAGGPNVTWCQTQHAFPLSNTCKRHCLDCGLHPGWTNTTGVQCSLQQVGIADGDVLRFRLRRTSASATLPDPLGMGMPPYRGSEWELTVQHTRVARSWRGHQRRGGAGGAHAGADRAPSTPLALGSTPAARLAPSATPMVLGTVFFQETFEGVSRLGAFHEHIGCTPCDAFYESEIRRGPWVAAPQPRNATVGFERKNFTCALFDVELLSDGAQFRTGPGTGPPSTTG